MEEIQIKEKIEYDEDGIEIMYLTEEEEEGLEEARRQIERGEVYDAREVIKKLRKKYGLEKV